MKRLPELLLAACLALVGVGVWMIPLPAASAGQEGVEIPLDCGSEFCVTTKAVMGQLIKSHNAHIDEIRKLKAELASRGSTDAGCQGMRGA